MGGSTRFKPPKHWKSRLFPPRIRFSREPEQTQGLDSKKQGTLLRHLAGRMSKFLQHNSSDLTVCFTKPGSQISKFSLLFVQHCTEKYDSMHFKSKSKVNGAICGQNWYWNHILNRVECGGGCQLGLQIQQVHQLQGATEASNESSAVALIGC